MTIVQNLLGLTCASILFTSAALGQAGKVDGIELKVSYGSYYLLPSLQTNSNLQIDSAKWYPDIWLSGSTQIGPKIRYHGAVELSNLPPRVIGTNFARDDYPITTGRFQESRVDYYSDSFHIRVGRSNFFDDTFRSEVFKVPTNGDGFSWVYQTKTWAFKHVIESLPAEISGENVFRRMLNYHHLAYQVGNFTVGAGEYFILTGPSIGLDMKRMNPFIPYSRNSHDSYRDIYDGYTLDSDSDNSLIKLFWLQKSEKYELIANLYIDEFLIDIDERETINDAILFNVNYRRDFYSNPRLPWNMEGSLSVSNPNFGQHPGPFTNTTSSGYALFEYSPGMLSLVYLKTELKLMKHDVLSISAHHERWQHVTILAPELRNKKKYLESLPVQKDNRYMLKYDREITRLHSLLSFSIWRVSDINNRGILVSVKTQYPFY